MIDELSTEGLLSAESLGLVSKTISMLAVDGVEMANSGHPGMPMGVSDIGAVLWLKYLRFNPQDPSWVNRDRFVLSNGHGSMFLYSMLHLCGYEISIDDLKKFRQLGSITPGHPEFVEKQGHETPGVECTTGPLGQGLGNAVGMAIAQKIVAARFNDSAKKFSGHDIVDHRVFCMAGDGCLMEGVTSEASSIAGHLGLGNLIVLYDDNRITIAGRTDLAFSENVGLRYEAYGWHVQHADGHDFDAISKAIDAAIKVTDKPSLIAFRTTIGKGSPSKADSSGVHGSPLGKAEVQATKEAIGWPLDKPFYVPDKVRDIFKARLESLQGDYEKWASCVEQWRSHCPDDVAAFDRQLSRYVPRDIFKKLLSVVAASDKPTPTRKLSGMALQVLSREVDALIGGSADLEPSTLTLIQGSSDISKGQFSGKNLRFGIREHAMGAIMNGLSYYGMFIPYGSTFLCFSDYMRPAIRLAALSKIPGLFIFTHDSVFLGEDGPTHQPVEHVNSLRMIPNLFVFRPADAIETAACYASAVARQNGPSAMILTRQDVPFISRSVGVDSEMAFRGGYTIWENVAVENGETPVNVIPDIVFVSSGSEVSVSIEAAKIISSTNGGQVVRVVSMPCWELFKMQGNEYRESLIPKSSKVVVVEAGTTFGWHSMLDRAGDGAIFIGIDSFGKSARIEDLANDFGFTPSKIAETVKKRILDGK